jgi:hypothetical protein
MIITNINTIKLKIDRYSNKFDSSDFCDRFRQDFAVQIEDGNLD